LELTIAGIEIFKAMFWKKEFDIVKLVESTAIKGDISYKSLTFLLCNLINLCSYIFYFYFLYALFSKIYMNIK